MTGSLMLWALCITGLIMSNRIYGRDLGSVEIHQHKNAEGVKDDYVLLPARVLSEVGLEVWEDTSVTPPLIRIRAGSPQKPTDLLMTPDEIPSPLEDEDPIEDVECPACQEKQLIYSERRNRYDCRNCHASHAFGELMARRILRQIPTATWTILDSVTAQAKVETAKGTAYLVTDLRGNFIGVQT